MPILRSMIKAYESYEMSRVHPYNLTLQSYMLADIHPFLMMSFETLQYSEIQNAY